MPPSRTERDDARHGHENARTQSPSQRARPESLGEVAVALSWSAAWPVTPRHEC